MKVLSKFTARPAMDGDGVNIKRVADFMNTRFDPYLMIDEIKSNDQQDFIGGFPPHPHRGIETFTYIRKGGFEHRDQLGNVKAIRAGDVQWMSTGRGVVHSEMPLADANEGLHGFQIWLNMPAKDKMRPAIYQDTTGTPNPVVSNDSGANLKALAGDWQFADSPQIIAASIQGLAGNGAIADLMLNESGQAQLDLSTHQSVSVFIYQGELEYVDTSGMQVKATEGQLLVIEPELNTLIKAGNQDTGILLLAGCPINEKIVHMGPFVMNSQAEINQAIDDYQQGRFGEIV
ncbi:pirin family protein [Shewanella sp. 1_MG-2023]|uniref:pirin family protein n=1 Tax=unclassified Shewanella TaxID=196818 RepID=UPI0026E1ED98|nr:MULTISPECIES: pirin family protein [unclassified Shewanella]MDO6611525.1 pirin family protein [Shewanella sp. 7_MG-2023]MDO6771380.1 pirin family protein [Shewanella sp. 2_MG-2023]MDO6793606.1 pirin family protein [Shewanella sp. 1_MG-2023]